MLRASVANLTGVQTIERYKSLAEIERRFRVHAQIFYLTLVLHRVMSMRPRASVRTLSPARALRLLSRIQSRRAMIGAIRFSGASQPPAEQARPFEDLSLPKLAAKAM